MSNISLFAIPAYWIISLLPHNYAVYIGKTANNGRWNNSNPRSSNWDATLRTSTPAALYATYERAEGAHKNGMENLPIFVGAILAGNIAKLGSGTLNTFAMGYLSMRILYTLIYINVCSNRYSFARTLVWFTSTMLCMGMYVKAGMALA